MIIDDYLPPFFGVELSGEPTRSQNSTVRCRRSLAKIRGSVATAAAAGAVSTTSQSPQNRLPDGLSAPHLGQLFASRRTAIAAKSLTGRMLAPAIGTAHQLTS